MKTNNQGESIDTRSRAHYHIECHDKFGKLKWEEKMSNLVPTAGLNEILDKFWKGSGYTASFFVGLIDGTPTVALADTMASNAGWDEVTDYDEATRQALTLGTVAAASVDNSASKATFTIDTDSTTIGGALICTNNTKGGTSGVLLSAAAFTGGDKSADDDDVLNVTVTITAANP